LNLYKIPLLVTQTPLLASISSELILVSALYVVQVVPLNRVSPDGVAAQRLFELSTAIQVIALLGNPELAVV